jgi:hypothetical protein
MSATLVLSTLPAKTLNFNGTVDPPLIRFTTPFMSTGWKKPLNVHHDRMLAVVVAVVDVRW